MIHDAIGNAHHYAALHTGFKAGFDFLAEYPAEGLPDGRYEIDGDRIYALVQRYETADAGALKLETHRKYIDIQFVARGRESLGWRNAEELSPGAAYDAENDVAFYPEKAASFATLGAGEFAVFYPHDAHMPRVCAPDGAGSVEKIVVKVRAG